MCIVKVSVMHAALNNVLRMIHVIVSFSFLLDPAGGKECFLWKFKEKMCGDQRQCGV